MRDWNYLSVRQYIACISYQMYRTPSSIHQPHTDNLLSVYLQLIPHTNLYKNVKFLKIKIRFIRSIYIDYDKLREIEYLSAVWLQVPLFLVVVPNGSILHTLPDIYNPENNITLH